LPRSTCWPIGTRERTAFALFLCTGHRLGDVRRMSWRDVEDSTIKVIQGKTKAELWIVIVVIIVVRWIPPSTD
jgi:enterobacteria phage integrase